MSKRIIFFGDSLTEEGLNENGYITQLKKIIEEQKDVKHTLLGAGVGGDKITDLYLRVENDVLAKDPDVVVIMVGVNDVWQKTLRGTGTESWKFPRFYEELVKKLKQKNISVVLCTPTVIGEKKDNADTIEEEIEQYAEIVRNVAKKYNCPLVDLRKEFVNYNLQHNINNADSGILTRDGVHLNENGNRLAAEKIYQVLNEKIL